MPPPRLQVLHFTTEHTRCLILIHNQGAPNVLRFSEVIIFFFFLYIFSTVHLSSPEWKPLNKGYEFLKIMDREAEKEERKQHGEKESNDKGTAQDQVDDGMFNFPVLTLSQTRKFRLFQTARVCRGQF